ncbi:MAG: Gfo/Idh/MocA family protein [Alistipes indistinctus]
MSESKLSRRNFLRLSAPGPPEPCASAYWAVTPCRRSSRKRQNRSERYGPPRLHRTGTAGHVSVERLPDDRRRMHRSGSGCLRHQTGNVSTRRVRKYYASKGIKPEVKTYENYQDILARPDIDAVVIATPDHYHALIAMAACRAGKDVYLEKPMTFTIYEGQQLCKAVRRNNRILQVGSQQRSDEEFIHVANLIREGRLGKISRVKVRWAWGGPLKPNTLAVEAIPAGLNWDLWQGPLPGKVELQPRAEPAYYARSRTKRTSFGEHGALV